MTTLTILGSGTLLPDDDRRSAAHLLETEGARLLLDCGSGTVHGFDRHGVDWKGLTHVAVTHFHADHVADLVPLLFLLKYGMRPPREAPLVLLGPEGLRAYLDAQVSAFGEWVLEPGFPLQVVELAPHGSWEEPDGAFTLRAHPTPHTDRSVAYRVDTPDGTVGYTGDTGPDEAVAAFLAGSDVLVAECSFPDPPETDTHLSPRSVAAMARAAGPALLLLTHIYPFLDPESAPALVRESGYGAEVVTAWDGDRVELEAKRPPRRISRGRG